jgi:hypothetical protein
VISVSGGDLAAATALLQERGVRVEVQR